MNETKPESAQINKLRKERDRFVALAFSGSDVLMELGSDAKVLFASGAVSPLIGRKAEDVIGRPLSELIAEDDRLLLEGLLGAARNKGRIESIKVRFQNGQGPLIHTFLSGYCLGDFGGRFFFSLRKNREGKKVAGDKILKRDAESGLFDADSFAQAVKERARSGKDDASQMTLIELAEYGSLKDRLGEEEEHNLLNTVGACLRANSVDGDMAARIGEDQFGLVHGAGLDVDALQNQIAEIAKTMDPEKKGVEVGTASVDMAASEMNGEDLANGLVFAINKFRHSKDGDFTIHNLATRFTSLVSEASETVTAFKSIVKHSDFDVAFQPIVDAFTGHVHHYEALVRFHKDKHGASPYETITFAEETGLISDFDLAMARKVIEKLAYTPKESTISVAVNISGSSVGSGKYLEGLFELLKLHPWSKDRLVFEITESSRLTDLDTANSFIQRLRKGGYDVCLDDFGAGAANFEYLSALDVDVVKLDGPVVKNAQVAPKGRAFLKALISLCKELEVETIAEMIDSKDGLDFVRDCGVDYVQGYLVGKPFIDMSGFLKKRDDDLFGSAA